MLRRAESSGDLSLTKNVSVSDDPFEFCHAQINPQRLEMTFPDGKITKIGRKEIGIMAHLKAHEGEVIPRKALIHAVWGIHANVRSRSLDQYIVKVRDFCRATLAHFKAPHYWKFVSSFPTTVTGKIQKFKIRDQAIEDLGLQDVSKIETA